MKAVLVFNVIAIIWLTAPVWQRFVVGAVAVPRKAASVGFLYGLAFHTAAVAMDTPPMPRYWPSFCGTMEWSLLAIIDAPLLTVLDWPNEPVRHAEWVRSIFGWDLSGPMFYAIYGGIQWALVGTVLLVGYALLKKYRNETPAAPRYLDTESGFAA